MKIPVKYWADLSLEEKKRILNRSEADISQILPVVQEIIDRVKRERDSALYDLTRRFDKAETSVLGLKVKPEEFQRAEESLAGEVKEAIRFGIRNTRLFHEKQKPEGLNFIEIFPGLLSGERATPIDSVGLYVPRGRGSFPSMLYMLAVPAAVAGVKRICVITPPAEDGSIDPGTLFTARECGIEEIYRVGGAQGIAALALGTESIPKVLKILGPGSRYVSAAKRLLSSVVDIGMPAGPSESVVIADETADPWKVTLDLLVEAEHGSDSSALLFTPSYDLGSKVALYLSDLLPTLPEPRRSFVRDVFSCYGGIFVTVSLEESCEITNTFAPEHLSIHTREPFDTLSWIRNAGEILLGPNIPFSGANYAAGVNAVLPTGGFAKTYSAISVRDFVKYSSVVYATEKGYNTLKPQVETLALYEGFYTHAKAFSERDKDPGIGGV